MRTHRILRGHLDDPVEQLGAHDGGDEPGPDPLDRVRAGGAAGEDRRERGLDGVHLQAGPALLEDLGDAGDVSAGADAGDDVVEAVGEVGEDLLGRRPAVDLDVGGVLELHRHPPAGRLGDELLRPGDRALHPELARGEVERRAVRRHELPALDRHRLGHDEDDPVALHRGHEGEADAGVPRGRLDDDAVRREDPLALRVLDHRERDPVLDAAPGVHPLLLHPHLDPRVEDAVHADVRRAADRVEDGLCLHVCLRFR